MSGEWGKIQTNHIIEGIRMSDLKPTWEQAEENKKLESEISELKRRIDIVKDHVVALEESLKRRTDLLNEIITKLKLLSDHGAI